MSLHDVQRAMRDALVRDDAVVAVPYLAGGPAAARRLAIHQRHYAHSLTDAIARRFPATAWLVGERCLRGAAAAFVHARPPIAPCIAEYGDAFPDFLATWPATATLDYLPCFAQLEWQVSRLALQTDGPSCGRAALSNLGGEHLVDAVATVQTGWTLLHGGWPVDDLFRAWMLDAVPASWALHPQTVRLFVRGSRGDLRIERLDDANAAFRTAVASGRPLGEAAATALARDAGFDAGAALAALVEDDWIVALHLPGAGDPR